MAIPYLVRTRGPVSVGGRTVSRGFLFDQGVVHSNEDLELVRNAYATIHPDLIVLTPGEAMPPAPPRVSELEPQPSIDLTQKKNPKSTVKDQ